MSVSFNIKAIMVMVTVLVCNYQFAQQEQHWSIEHRNEILLDLSKADNVPYQDNIEMSGVRVSGIVTYSIDESRKLSMSRQVFFPQLRTFIKTNDPEWKHYRAYLSDTFSDDILPTLIVDDKIYEPGKAKSIRINGMLVIEHEAEEGIAVTRTFYPSTDERLFVEEWKLTNVTKEKIVLQGKKTKTVKHTKGVKGDYSIFTDSNLDDTIEIAAGKSYRFSVQISASMNNESRVNVDAEEHYEKRIAFLEEMKNSLQLVTPNETLNTLFEFSKIRGSESIFESKLGMIHSPGGGRYYVGFWANDQAEYINPFFPYLGYGLGNDAALNMYELYLKEIDSEYKNIRYSFEMEGDAPISPLDRGDAAMIAYGAAQFAMASGDKEVAEKIWPLIKWCLEYNKRNLNKSGVVISESDEMEGRIETGNANLSTSSLYYGALNLAADLGVSLGRPKKEVSGYRKTAVRLKKNIESYFGATIEGLETYKYYKEHQNLRHWICLPLVVQINDRKKGTIDALFNKLWTENGVHVEKNDQNPDISKIFWDRGTLYALRGTFLAGATERSLTKLQEFSAQRLLGDRVPYVVEAYPEGNMAHLSAESGLYCRVFTEGMFGIVPTGLKSFSLTPRLPSEWDKMELNKIKAFNKDFHIKVFREGDKIRCNVVDSNGSVFMNSLIKDGDSVEVFLK
ncbi:six-hairpin glycosidase-like protein [Zobellia roscoffensis]|uniref:six-hairpin glycosidase-like protein n=1 Tax=Zobellia roscoffensis TaxID=2779508 RepID=UPI00188A24F6|nr:six-hairpin glycosidase-like protein [Zobellia roscoffensis]